MPPCLFRAVPRAGAASLLQFHLPQTPWPSVVPVLTSGLGSWAMVMLSVSYDLPANSSYGGCLGCLIVPCPWPLCSLGPL